MRILIYTDPHFCATSSIVRTRGEKYTTRLENEIKSIDWAEKLAMDTKCDAIFCLGDFFDKSELSAEELTALGDIKWANIQHYFIVGNHEMGSSNLSNSSAHILNLKADIEVIDKETRFDIESKLGLISLQLIPYVLESDRKPFAEYVKTANPEGKKYDKVIVFSHNDLKGIRYGTLESRQGFDVAEIEKYCDLFINGHLHNGSYINNNPNMINLGNLTGQNFSEDATKYSHCAAVLDTDTFEVFMVENPFALNFYKFDVSSDTYPAVKQNAVVSISCPQKYISTIREKVQSDPNILCSRIIMIPETTDVENVEISDLANIDHIEQFKSYILQTLGTNPDVIEELEEISK